MIGRQFDCYFFPIYTILNFNRLLAPCTFSRPLQKIRLGGPWPPCQVATDNNTNDFIKIVWSKHTSQTIKEIPITIVKAIRESSVLNIYVSQMIKWGTMMVTCKYSYWVQIQKKNKYMKNEITIKMKAYLLNLIFH